MSATAITTASTEFRWGKEATYGTPVSPLRTFGLNQDIKPAYMPTPIELPEAGQRVLSGFAFGTNKHDVDVGFAMTNPWFLQLLLGQATVTAAVADTSPAVHKFVKTTTPVPFTLEVRVKGTDAGAAGGGLSQSADFKSVLSGCTVVSGTLECGIDQVAKVGLRVTAGKRTDTGVAFAAFSDDAAVDDFAYTSVGGTLQVHDGTNLVDVARVKDFSLNFEIGQDQEYELGSINAFGALAGRLRYTGRFSKTLVNEKYLKLVNDRKTHVSFTVKFSNKASGDDERFVKLTFKNVIFGKHEMALRETDRVDDVMEFTAIDMEAEAGSGDGTLLS